MIHNKSSPTQTVELCNICANNNNGSHHIMIDNTQTRSGLKIHSPCPSTNTTTTYQIPHASQNTEYQQQIWDAKLGIDRDIEEQLEHTLPQIFQTPKSKIITAGKKVLIHYIAYNIIPWLSIATIIIILCTYGQIMINPSTNLTFQSVIYYSLLLLFSATWTISQNKIYKSITILCIITMVWYFLFQFIKNIIHWKMQTWPIYHASYIMVSYAAIIAAKHHWLPKWLLIGTIIYTMKVIYNDYENLTLNIIPPYFHYHVIMLAVLVKMVAKKWINIYDLTHDYTFWIMNMIILMYFWYLWCFYTWIPTIILSSYYIKVGIYGWYGISPLDCLLMFRINTLILFNDVTKFQTGSELQTILFNQYNGSILYELSYHIEDNTKANWMLRPYAAIQSAKSAVSNIEKRLCRAISSKYNHVIGNILLKMCQKIRSNVSLRDKILLFIEGSMPLHLFLNKLAHIFTRSDCYGEAGDFDVKADALADLTPDEQRDLMTIVRNSVQEVKHVIKEWIMRDGTITINNDNYKLSKSGRRCKICTNINNLIQVTEYKDNKGWYHMYRVSGSEYRGDNNTPECKKSVYDIFRIKVAMEKVGATDGIKYDIEILDISIARPGDKKYHETLEEKKNNIVANYANHGGVFVPYFGSICTENDRLGHNSRDEGRKRKCLERKRVLDNMKKVGWPIIRDTLTPDSKFAIRDARTLSNLFRDTN